MSRRPIDTQKIEEAALGVALLDNSFFDKLDATLFQDSALRAVVVEGKRLLAEGLAVDEVTLPDDTLARVGGAARIVELINAVPSVAAGPGYLTKLMEADEQRRMLKAADWLARAAHEDEAEPRRGLIRKARGRLQEIENDWAGGAERLGLLSADEILATEWPEPVWTVPGILPAGLSLLAGLPKIGKSWLALQIAQAKAAGGKALGRDIVRGPVLYLALEDPPRRLKERMQRQHWSSGLDCEFLPITAFADRIGDLRNGGSEVLAAQIARRQYSLVVIDTLSRATSGDQKDIVEMTAVLTPVQVMAHEYGCAVLMVDHHRKGFGQNPDVISDILGSIGKGAVADCLLGLYRERGKQGAKLVIVGRDVEEQEIALEMDWTSGCWQCAEHSSEISPAKMDLLMALEGMGETTLGDLVEAVDRNKGNVYKDLADLVNARRVQKVGAGRGNVRYRLISQLTMSLDE